MGGRCAGRGEGGGREEEEEEYVDMEGLFREEAREGTTRDVSVSD